MKSFSNLTSIAYPFLHYTDQIPLKKVVLFPECLLHGNCGQLSARPPSPGVFMQADWEVCERTTAKSLYPHPLRHMPWVKHSPLPPFLPRQPEPSEKGGGTRILKQSCQSLAASSIPSLNCSTLSLIPTMQDTGSRPITS